MFPIPFSGMEIPLVTLTLPIHTALFIGFCLLVMGWFAHDIVWTGDTEDQVSLHFVKRSRRDALKALVLVIILLILTAGWFRP